MKKNWMYVALIAATVSLAACDGGNGNGGGGDTTPPPPPSNAIPFVQLVRQLFANTNETSAPLPINGLELDTSDESPTQFDFLLI